MIHLDRNSKNGKVRGGGVCIFVADTLLPFTIINDAFTCSSSNYEVLTIEISQPNMQFMCVSCVYKPLTGKIGECIDSLKKKYSDTRREVWILGDFNVDFLDRRGENRFINVFKTIGVRQLITTYTRPNVRGGTCLDWIATNTDFIRTSGTLKIFLYLIFCSSIVS